MQQQIMEVNEIMEAIKKEINMMNSISYDPIEEFEIFNDETKEYEIKSEFSKDLIANSKDRIFDEFFGEKFISKVYRFDVSKIYNYNDLNDFWIEKVGGKFIKRIKHNENYNTYKNEINTKIENEYKDLLEFLAHKKVRINVAFFINYDQKDLDNLTNGLNQVLTDILKDNYDKAFIDSIFNAAGKSDNCIRKYTSEVFSSRDVQGDEFILLEVEALTEAECNSCELLKKFHKQK